MYLHECTINNYSCHKATTIKLKPLTVFVGPCGAGKSAVFDALINFSMLARGRIKEAFSPGPFSYGATKFHGAARGERIGYQFKLSEVPSAPECLEYEVDYEQDVTGSSDEPEFRILSERLTRAGGSAPAVLFNRSPRRMASELRAAEEFIEPDRGIFAAIRQAQTLRPQALSGGLVTSLAVSISRFNKSRLEPSELRQPGYLPDPALERAFLGFRGEGLASLLYHWHTTAPDVLRAIEDELRKVVPEFADFEFNLVGTNKIGFSIRYSDQRGVVAAPKLSDGTLIFLGLAVLLRGPARPPVLCIEEPENGLNPPAIRATYEIMRRVAFEGAEGQRTQILFSSHSPLVLCDTWNGDDRDFMYQVQIDAGSSVAIPMVELLKDYHLGTTKDGKRDHLSFNHACEILAGHR